ncbi:MAG: hypothetical protein AB1861_22300 [Cyanobacteriota bacterium]
MASIVLGLLAVNGIIYMIGFGSNQAVLQTVHNPYLGSPALYVLFLHMLFLHALLVLKISLTIQ